MTLSLAQIVAGLGGLAVICGGAAWLFIAGKTLARIEGRIETTLENVNALTRRLDVFERGEDSSSPVGRIRKLESQVHDLELHMERRRDNHA